MPKESVQAESVGYSVVDHVLCFNGKPVKQVPSANHNGPIKPTVLIMHYTGGPNARGAINALTNSKGGNRVSAHLVLDRDGTVTQLLPLNVRGWHVGPSVFKARKDVNSFSIGIEMVNCGLLAKSGAGGYVERLGNSKIANSDVVLAAHKFEPKVERPWQVYPLKQYEAAVAISRALVAAYGIKDIAGHEDVCIPKLRKTDPGPAFNLNRFSTDVLGRA